MTKDNKRILKIDLKKLGDLSTDRKAKKNPVPFGCIRACTTDENDVRLL